jgi:hypothetical protein
VALSPVAMARAEKPVGVDCMVSGSSTSAMSCGLKADPSGNMDVWVAVSIWSGCKEIILGTSQALGMALRLA